MEKGRTLNLLTTNVSNPTSSESWDAYWRHYEAQDYINYTMRLLETLQRRVDLRGAQVLEIGAGTGGDASMLASAGAHVIALDFAGAALERTLVTAQRAGTRVWVVQADARQLPFEGGAFDVVYHQGFLEHFTDPEVFIREQRRVLRDGGYLLVDVPQRYNPYTITKRRLIRAGCWPYGGWEREFSLRELSALLHANGFRVLESYGRGYYPRIFERIRNLGKIEKKLFRRNGPPSRLWQRYDAGWRWFEQTWLGCNTLQCVGVLAQAVG